MAELETEVDVQDTDYELDVQDTQDDAVEEEITYEQALEWKKKAERLEKAEKALVERKKADKLASKAQTQSPIDVKEAFKQIREEEKFFEKNPDAESYRDDIEGYKAKWLSLEDSYLLASKNDKNIDELRWVYGKSIVTGESSPWDLLKLVSIWEYDKMNTKAKEEYNEKTKSKYGWVRFK